MSTASNLRLHIGEEYGIYTIVDVMEYKSKDGHAIFKGVCKECGYERCGKLSTFKQNNVQTCEHKKLLNNEQIRRWYEKNKRQCKCCGKDIPLGNLGFIEYKERKFCDNSCAASYNNKIYKKRTKKISWCKNCGQEIKYPNQFCSIQCQHNFKYKSYIERWKNGQEDGMSGQSGISGYIKRYIHEKYNNQCCKCGWHEVNPFSGKIPLEVHHKDGNYRNNQEDNLELLCPNCHALTQSYKSLNNGNGREDRYKNK